MRQEPTRRRRAPPIPLRNLTSPLYGLVRIASKAALIRTRSSWPRAFRSRPAGLVITKSHGMLPRLVGDEIAFSVGPPRFRYRATIWRGRILGTDLAQTKVN